jgi:hexosaminidase
MWGETVDPSDLFNTVWPRAAGVRSFLPPPFLSLSGSCTPPQTAERLWSDRSVTDTAAALPRLEQFRCRLTSRGIQAAAVNNALARSGPPGPGSCYAQ